MAITDRLLKFIHSFTVSKGPSAKGINKNQNPIRFQWTELEKWKPLNIEWHLATALERLSLKGNHDTASQFLSQCRAVLNIVQAIHLPLMFNT